MNILMMYKVTKMVYTDNNVLEINSLKRPLKKGTNK